MLSKKIKCRVFILLLCTTALCVLLNGQTSTHLSRIFSEYSPGHFLDSGPCACHKCISEGDGWFMERFNKSLKPFLSRKYNLSEDDFNWWKHLQYERSTWVGYRAVVDELFHMFPDGQIFMDSDPGRCRTCAVVGNSGTLRGSHYGALIDFHDVVIRMNRARTKGFEVDVGTRTTHHVMYPESAMDLDPTTHLVLFPYKTLDLRWLVSAFTTGSVKATYQSVKQKIQANKDLVMVLNPAFIKYVHEIWLDKNGKYPSTGFLALVLGMHICDEVNVFGYGADKDGDWNHYWEELKNKHYRTGIHGGENEFKLINQLSQIQKVNFFKGW
ncbi:CMP-N-acetylneuraminate-beta-galactosamide-alpha-2,3-sialyltransferase 1-like [Centroberyx gerrardi]